jgi:hypothetical protein
LNLWLNIREIWKIGHNLFGIGPKECSNDSIDSKPCLYDIGAGVSEYHQQFPYLSDEIIASPSKSVFARVYLRNILYQILNPVLGY